MDSALGRAGLPADEHSVDRGHANAALLASGAAGNSVELTRPIREDTTWQAGPTKATPSAASAWTGHARCWLAQ